MFKNLFKKKGKGYIVNYEIMRNGIAIAWGNFSLENGSGASASDVLGSIHKFVAETHTVDKNSIRVVGLFKL